MPEALPRNTNAAPSLDLTRVVARRAHDHVVVAIAVHVARRRDTLPKRAST